jgi:hypothetical protein
MGFSRDVILNSYEFIVFHVISPTCHGITWLSHEYWFIVGHILQDVLLIDGMSIAHSLKQ